MSKVPVLVMAFNRPDLVRKAMEPICKYKPEKLYLECDGPRSGKEGEENIVSEVCEVMTNMVDWDCDIKTLFRKNNLGCARAVYESITWFFENEDYGVIIEDDVVVSQDFFRLCEELLPMYQNNPFVQQIAAFNPTASDIKTSRYTYTKRPMIWGWATWKNKWDKYMDMNMSKWQQLKIIKLIKIYGVFQGLYMWRVWTRVYNKTSKSDSWDTRWHFAAIANDLINISPLANLSLNIGCSSDGAHFKKGDIDPYKHMRIGSLIFPIIHPEKENISRKQKWIDNQEFFRLRIVGAKKRIIQWVKRLF